MKKILIIQTASIGDVILTTAIAEKIHAEKPNAAIDFLVKKGNETLFHHHPYIQKVLIRDKTLPKKKCFLQLLQQIYAEKYDLIVNVQRHSFTALLTLFGGAKETSGFKGNLWSIFYSHRSAHRIQPALGMHETERNQQLIQHLTGKTPGPVMLYPDNKAFAKVSEYKTIPYITIAPASLWFTKQFPKEKWSDLIRQIPETFTVYLLGGKNDNALCEDILTHSERKNCLTLAGKFSLLETAALMKHSVMNFVNDSAPLHLASAVNAPVTAIFCSTVPGFGFGPLSEKSFVVETKKSLPCRPCGLHGKKKCPKKHFDCAMTIKIEDLINKIDV